MEEERLATHLRHDHRPAARHHPAGDSLAQPVARALAGRFEAARGRDVEVPVVRVEEGDRRPQHAVRPPQDLEHAVEAGPEVKRAGEGLTHVEQRGEPPELARGISGAGSGGGREIGGGRCGDRAGHSGALSGQGNGNRGHGQA